MYNRGVELLGSSLFIFNFNNNAMTLDDNNSEIRWNIILPTECGYMIFQKLTQSGILILATVLD